MAKKKKKATGKKASRKGRSAKVSRPRRRSKKRDEMIAKLRHFIRTRGPVFLEDNNITSLGIGYKIKDGKRTDKLCVQFTVNSKPESGTGLEALETNLIPETLEIEGATIPTDVIERGFQPSHQIVDVEEINVRKKRIDPIVPGVSVSHPSGSAGTLGLVVFDRQTGDACMLSNWHVLHRADGEIGDGVVQPGPHDDNNVQLNHSGTLIRSHLGAAGDCAIARIEERNFNRNILELDASPTQIRRVDLDDFVVKSGRTTGVTRGIVRRIDVMATINYAGVGPRQIGGFEIGPEEDAPPGFEISMGGDSGSAWLIANDDGTASSILVGLHFAGETSDNPDEHALACNAHAVFKKLDIALEPISEDDLATEALLGYDQRFLSTEVPTPRLSTSQRADAFKLAGKHLIPYTHFSVCVSKSRGLARFVAWNIDGGRMRRISRRGTRFLLDPRVNEEFQHGNELYRNNSLDRGHIARRADLTWGSNAEAKRANRESFHYTNIAPQHESFNQSSRGGLWGALENAVFDDVDVEDLRVSVMGGPVFRASDPVHRGVKIPREFWKLVAYTDTADEQFKVRAFLLTQQDLLTDIEALELDPFRIFQLSLGKLKDATSLDFEPLEEFDTFGVDIEIEGLEDSRRAQAREIQSREDIFLLR